MSHYVVLVTGEDIEEQLAPYDENIAVEPYFDPECKVEDWENHWYVKHVAKEGKPIASVEELVTSYNARYGPDGEEGKLLIQDDQIGSMSRYNPLSKWDWYAVGGRWRDVFTLKDGELDDSALKSEIDLDAMKARAEAKANKSFDEFEEATSGVPTPQPWSVFRAQYDNIDTARTAWRELPFNKALLAAKIYVFECPVERYCLTYPNPREEYVRRWVTNIIPAFSILHEGNWITKGTMGWFGMSNDDMTDDEWKTKVAEFIDSLPEETRLTIVDLHI